METYCSIAALYGLKKQRAVVDVVSINGSLLLTKNISFPIIKLLSYLRVILQPHLLPVVIAE